MLCGICKISPYIIGILLSTTVSHPNAICSLLLIPDEDDMCSNCPGDTADDHYD